MWAVLSDIHANLEALDAVLVDVARHPVSQIICLGDLVGYGPNPIECLERAKAWDVVLTGDFDQNSLYEDAIQPAMPQALADTIGWNHRQLAEPNHEALWEFLAALPRQHQTDDFLFVHGSPRNPIYDYLFPEDVYNHRKMTRIGDLMGRYCVCGHTHVPGVFLEPEMEAGDWQFSSPEELSRFYRLDGRKTIINVGSVGQPRDGDWRACYALIDGWDVTFRRVEYDVDATIAKIHAIPELPNMFGDRLREGA